MACWQQVGQFVVTKADAVRMAAVTAGSAAVLLTAKYGDKAGDALKQAAKSMHDATPQAGTYDPIGMGPIANWQMSESGAPKDVYIDPNKYPDAAGHAENAQKAGQPDVLTVQRPGASDRRNQATSGHSTQPGTDRDEYPPAVTAESGRGASVRNIPSSDNRGAGASVGNQIRNVPNGGTIRIIPKPKPDNQ